MLEHSTFSAILSGLDIFLGFVIVPLWLAAGVADWFCHRITSIERTSGTTESVLHLIQFGLAGVPLIAALFLEVNATLLLILAAFVILHHAVAYIDVRYANDTREVRPIEQMVHSFLELLPITAWLLIAVLNFEQVLGIFGEGDATFGLHARLPTLPPWYLVTVLVAAFVFD